MPARPLTELPAVQWATLIGVMTDIDDTLTRDGAIEPEALAALGELKSGGSGKTVTNRKQAIAIGLSEAREAERKKA